MTNQLESLNPAGHPKENAELTSARTEVLAGFDSQSSNLTPKSAEPQSGFLTFDNPYQSVSQLQLDRDQEHQIVDPASRDSERLPGLPEQLGPADQTDGDKNLNSNGTCQLTEKLPLHSGRLEGVSAADQLKIDKIEYDAKVDALCEGAKQRPTTNQGDGGARGPQPPSHPSGKYREYSGNHEYSGRQRVEHHRRATYTR